MRFSPKCAQETFAYINIVKLQVDYEKGLISCFCCVIPASGTTHETNTRRGQGKKHVGSGSETTLCEIFGHGINNSSSRRNKYNLL